MTITRSFHFVLLLSSFVVILIFPSCKQSTSTNHSQKKIPVSDVNDSCIYYQSKSKSLDSILLHSTTYDEKLAIQANNIFVKCALLCQHDSISPMYLIKAAQLSQGLHHVAMSEKYLQKILKDYPHSKFIPAAKFLLAQYYADAKILNQPDKAKTLLQEIIKEYPKSVWAENATAALQWIGKSDEDILKEIKSRSK